MTRCIPGGILTAFTILLCITSPEKVDAEIQNCTTSAQSWISQCNSPKVDILRDHSQARCVSAKQWMLENQGGKTESSWKQMCTDLILIWGHKECVYFRDYIEHDAYKPCKKWTAQMFKQCMANNLSWFSTTSIPPQ